MFQIQTTHVTHVQALPLIFIYVDLLINKQSLTYRSLSATAFQSSIFLSVGTRITLPPTQLPNLPSPSRFTPASRMTVSISFKLSLETSISALLTCQRSYYDEERAKINEGLPEQLDFPKTGILTIANSNAAQSSPPPTS